MVQVLAVGLMVWSAAHRLKAVMEALLSGPIRSIEAQGRLSQRMCQQARRGDASSPDNGIRFKMLICLISRKCP